MVSAPLRRLWRSFRAPRVTVILPTYNWAPVLPYSIGSVLDQTFEDFEILVVGDGCTDESPAVVRKISDPRVHWINLPANTGSQAGPNQLGLSRARGESIAYIGHDDLWLPRHLEYLTTAGAPLAVGQQLRIDPGRSPYLTPHPSWSYQRGQWLSPTSVMHERDVAKRIGGWRFPNATGALDPEADLWARITDLRGPPALVRRLTSVKLPAALREGVYRARPFHEQAKWLARIRAANDPESSLLEACNEPPSESDAVVVPEIPGLDTMTAAERHSLRRRFKGIDR
jgi:glycosyltransferase involved in cell wall biosynthesis